MSAQAHTLARSFPAQPVQEQSSVGGRKRREGGLQHIPDPALMEALARTPLDAHVVWTGEAACGRDNSVRAQAMACIPEPGKAMSLRALLQRAARLEGDYGLDPDLVRNALRQHQSARPAVMFLLKRQASGDFVALTDVPFAGGKSLRISAGSLILDRTGRTATAALAGVAPPRLAEA